MADPPPPTSTSISMAPAPFAARRARAQTLTQRLYNPPPSPMLEVPGLSTSPPAASGLGNSSPPATPGSGFKPRSRAGTTASVSVRARRMSSVGAATAGSPAMGVSSPGAEAGQQERHDEQSDLLDVIDPSYSASHLSNFANAVFIPTALTRTPVYDLNAASSTTTSLDDEEAPTPAPSSAPSVELDPVDEHIKHLLKKQRREKRKAKAKEAWAGAKVFLKTPLGIFFAIYGILVVVFGAALVLMLMIPFNSYRKKLWVEICSQILTGLFTITSGLMFPWRILDTYRICVIAHYAGFTKTRRKKLGLPPLQDPSDLPDSGEDGFLVVQGGEKVKKEDGEVLHGPSAEAKAAEGTTSQTGASDAESEQQKSVELKAVERSVLSPKQEERLRRAQIAFGRSQTFYRPHETPTHHAFKISWAIWICLANCGNSVFQWMLCGTMWGIDRFNRPAWTTGALIPLSFGCGIAAGIMIWQGGERTKKKKEVEAEVWKLLKHDEEVLAQKRAEATAKRTKEEKEKHERHHATPGVHNKLHKHHPDGTVTPVSATHSRA